MSEENNESKGTSESKNPLETVQNIGAVLANLQQNNPKALYGGIAGLVIVLWFLMSGSGGGDVKVSVKVGPGQTVTLNNPNGGKSLIDEQPGNFSMNAEDEKSFICYAEANTSAKVLDETMIPTMGGASLPFVKVEITSGSCQGKSGWTSKTNIKS
jgi:hypothetical protein